jgi:hypothetical protein
MGSNKLSQTIQQAEAQKGRESRRLDERRF